MPVDPAEPELALDGYLAGAEHSDLVSGEIPSRQLLETVASVGQGTAPAQAERLAAALAPLERATEAQHLCGLIPTPAFRQNVQRLLDAWAEQAGPNRYNRVRRYRRGRPRPPRRTA